LSKSATDAFKVWPTNADRNAFQRVMDCDSPKSLLEEYGKDAAAASLEAPIPDCYLYFHRQVTEWLGANAGEARISALYVTLRERLRLVVIDLDHGDDAQMIFETLNARGTPLLAADLIKNSLLAEVERAKVNAAAAYDKYWKPFDEGQDFWRAPIGRGHARRARIESFIHHTIILMSGEESSASELYSGYKRLVRSGVGGTVEDRLKTFRRYGDIYRRLVEGSLGQSLGRLLYRLEAMDVGTAYPFLIALFDSHPGKFDLMLEVCGRLDSFLVRRMVCRMNTRGYNKIFLDLVSAVRDCDDPIAAVEKRLSSGRGENERWPDEAAFKTAWLTTPLYTSVTRGRLRIILEALEEEMRSETAEVADCPRELTIEHLMPQTWEPHWPLANGADHLKLRHEREKRIHTIGNLTLLTDKLNKEQSNFPWLATATLEGKRAALRRQTVLRLNKTVADSDVWGEDAIDARAAALFELAKKIWPGPLAPA
jgi:hypothetical protein